MDQTCLAKSGGFGPINVPLFQAVRFGGIDFSFSMAVLISLQDAHDAPGGPAALLTRAIHPPTLTTATRPSAIEAGRGRIRVLAQPTDKSRHAQHKPDRRVKIRSRMLGLPQAHDNQRSSPHREI